MREMSTGVPIEASGRLRGLLEKVRVRKCRKKKKGKLGAHAIKRVAASAHLPTPWLFEPAKRSDDRADYFLDCSFLPQWEHQVHVFTLEWSGARPVGEQ